MTLSTVARPWWSASSTVARPCPITSSTVARPCSIAVSTVERLRLIAFFTVPGIRLPLVSTPPRSRLNHNLHGVGLGVGRNFDSIDRRFERKTVRDQLRQVKSIAVAAEDQIGHFIQNPKGRRIRP